MNKQKEAPRRLILMAVAVAINYGLYGVAHVFHLPLWMDTVGTAYVALALEPAAGLIVAFLTNFLESAAVYGVGSIVYYFVGAAAALSFGLLLRKNGRVRWWRLPLAGLSYFVCGSLLSWVLTLWRTGAANMDSGWERFFMEAAVSAGCPRTLACLFGIAVLKALDVLVMMAVLPLLWQLTPRAWRTEELREA